MKRMMNEEDDENNSDNYTETLGRRQTLTSPMIAGIMS